MKEQTDLLQLDRTVFYALDKAIKSYRQFAQRNIRACELDITIDQWLLLKTIHDEPELSQAEMAERVFKDHASVTRMIELLVRQGFLGRSPHPADRRRYRLELTPEGRKVYDQLVPIVAANRAQALRGIAEEEIHALQRLLHRITENCQNPETP